MATTTTTTTTTTTSSPQLQLPLSFHQNIIPPPPDFASFGFDDPLLSFAAVNTHLGIPPPPPIDIDMGLGGGVTHGTTDESGLLSTAESSSLFGFLDNFEWDFDPMLPPGMPVFSPTTTNPSGFDANGMAVDEQLQHPPSLHHAHSQPSMHSDSYSHAHMPPHPPHSHSQPILPTHALQSPSQQQQQQPPLPSPRSQPQSQSQPPKQLHPRTHPRRPSPPSPTSPTSPTSPSPSTAAARAAAKPLLSTPQKRLNHILSEQKRRNAIRDGYATLTTMLAPAGAPVGSGIPTRGRPKGSGRQGNGGAKGKSGVLFRAVEYCKWLEEGCEALRREVERVELAAGIRGVTGVV